MKRLTILLLTAALAVGVQGCKKKKRASKKPATHQSARPDTRAARPSRPVTRPGRSSGRSWAKLVSRLPLESDALVYLSLAKLKTTPQWGLISGVLSAAPLYKSINAACGLTLADLPETAVAATAYHRQDTTILLSGPKFSADRILSCLPKLATQKGITWTPQGPTAGLFTVESMLCCGLRVARTGAHELTLTMGEAAKAQAQGQKRPQLGENAKIFGLVDRVGGTDLWLLSLGLPPAIKGKLPSANAISQMRALALGINLTDQGLALKLVVDMRAKKAASDLAAVLNRYLPGLDRYAANLAQLKPIFSKLHIGADANFLTLSISLTWADLGKLQALRSLIQR